MPTDTEIEKKFWDELNDSPFVMLGLEGTRDGATQPMTACFENNSSPLWFFTSKDNDIVTALEASNNGIASYAAKGHDLFASIRGTLSIDDDRATIDRLWSPVIAEWYEHGKDDPKLALLRLDVEDAKVWLSDISGFLKPALNRLLGRKPESGMNEKVAEVDL